MIHVFMKWNEISNFWYLLSHLYINLFKKCFSFLEELEKKMDLLTLKIRLTNTSDNKILLLKFQPTTIVYDALKIIREKIIDSSANNNNNNNNDR